MTIRVAILTVSTKGARGERQDASGDAIASWAVARGYAIARRALVGDDEGAIVRTLLAWCDAGDADLVLTTGGTGLSPSDVTPEATAAVIERDVPAIAEWLRLSVAPRFPRALLSRGRCGIRHRTLIVNLPGSTSGVQDSLAALESVIEHGIAVLRGDVGDHAPGR